MFESDEKWQGRRAFLVASCAALGGLAWWRYAKSDAVPVEAAPAGIPKQVTIVEFTDSGERKGGVTVPTIVKSEAEGKEQLSPLSFEVTRNAATERPFTGELLNEHGKGVFRCICCDTALYSSETKFES